MSELLWASFPHSDGRLLSAQLMKGERRREGRKEGRGRRRRDWDRERRGRRREGMRRVRREEGKEKERKEGGGRVREESVWNMGQFMCTENLNNSVFLYNTCFHKECRMLNTEHI